jgi:hypothetical protein
VLGRVASAVVMAVVIFAAEMLRLRSWIYYGAAAVILVAVVNAALGFAIYFGLRGVGIPEFFEPGLRMAVISLIAGLEASLFYWLVAGCNAGTWQEQWE